MHSVARKVRPALAPSLDCMSGIGLSRTGVRPEALVTATGRTCRRRPPCRVCQDNSAFEQGDADTAEGFLAHCVDRLIGHLPGPNGDAAHKHERQFISAAFEIETNCFGRRHTNVIGHSHRYRALLAIHENLTAVRTVDPRQDLDQRGFFGTVFTDDGQNLAGDPIQIDIGYRL